MLQVYRQYWKRGKPYTLTTYRAGAEALLSERLEYLRSLETPASERFAAKLCALGFIDLEVKTQHIQRHVLE